MWRRRRVRKKKPVSRHYQAHKELARGIIHERLEHWSGFYGLTYNRVAIKNQKTCWGSCSEHGNLNFNYKIVFLPEPLMDYVIVHELCHLYELNHSPAFWAHVARAMPDYKAQRSHLRKMTHIPAHGFPSSSAARAMLD
ncbi:MAG: M48 family metallopeptidase [Candidatus Pacebacteria bacterium]|nr:M48 family metallopeptidase [Candidatus Paceibacterota bacterium]